MTVAYFGEDHRLESAKLEVDGQVVEEEGRLDGDEGQVAPSAARPVRHFHRRRRRRVEIFLFWIVVVVGVNSDRKSGFLESTKLDFFLWNYARSQTQVIFVKSLTLGPIQ